ncbi:MAG: hypothetical protein ACFBQW_06110 [Sphingomonadaceae bacterium]
MEQENRRTRTARRHDDSDIVERAGAEETPDQGGRADGELERDIGSRAERERQIEGKTGVTRVTGADKSEEEDERRFNETYHGATKS